MVLSCSELAHSGSESKVFAVGILNSASTTRSELVVRLQHQNVNSNAFVCVVLLLPVIPVCSYARIFLRFYVGKKSEILYGKRYYETIFCEIEGTRPQIEFSRIVCCSFEIVFRRVFAFEIVWKRVAVTGKFVLKQILTNID